MAETSQILRRSIHTFLNHYQYFTSFPAMLGFPFALSLLLSQSFSVFPSSSSSSFLQLIAGNLRNLFHAAGFPSSDFFIVLNHKLSQTIFSSIFSLLFILTFFFFSKASVIQFLIQKKPTFSPFHPYSLYFPLLLTQISNVFLIISANATVFSLLFLAFTCLEGFGCSSPNLYIFLSVAGAVLYSVVLANTFLICNLALVLSGTEKSGGYMAIIKSCVLMQGRTSIALSLALPSNLALAAIEALFQYRIIRPYRIEEKIGPSMVLEGTFIAYLYSIIIVLDTIVTAMFFKSCSKSKPLLDLEENESYADLKIIHDLL